MLWTVDDFYHEYTQYDDDVTTDDGGDLIMCRIIALYK